MSWLKNNSAAVVLAVVTVLAGIALFMAQGCMVDDWVKADMPREVQTTLGVPPKVPLSQARDIIEEYHAKIERQAKDKAADVVAFQRRAARELESLTETLQKEGDEKAADLEDFKRHTERVSLALADRVAHANEVAGFLASLLNTGLGAAQSSGLGALPGGSLLLAGLTGAVGLMVRKPGTQREIDAAYDEGQKAAINAAKELKT